MRKLHAAVGTLTTVVALAGAGAAPAMAATSVTHGSTSAHPSTVRPNDASWCGGAPGPGTWNNTCIDVSGSGLYVGSVQGDLNATTAPYFPADICYVTVHVFGIYEGGTPYSDTATNTGCGTGELGEVFFPQANFQDQSLLCEQTEWNNEWSSPVCITIHA